MNTVKTDISETILITNFGAVSLNSNKCFLVYSLSFQVFLMPKNTNKYNVFIPILPEKRLIGFSDPCHAVFCGLGDQGHLIKKCT